MTTDIMVYGNTIWNTNVNNTVACQPVFPNVAGCNNVMIETTPTIADTLLVQAKSRIAEIQKRLDELPALEAEIARLRRMVDAAEGK